MSLTVTPDPVTSVTTILATDVTLATSTSEETDYSTSIVATATAPAQKETEHGYESTVHAEKHTVDHLAEASDATAVSSGSDSDTPPSGVWTPGTYVLLNAKSGTAVDMSGADNKTLIGYPMHGGPNQQVRDYSLRSVPICH